jgi:Domain of Unknown Function (DUF349)
MGLLERLRAQPGWKDPDPKARRAAVRKLEDPALLAEVSRADPDPTVRDEADEMLQEIALSSQEAAALSALASLLEPRRIVAVAREAALLAVSRAALERVTDAKALGSVARHGGHAAVRLEALARLGDPAEIAVVALKSPHKDSALAALEQVTAFSEIVSEVAGKARNPAASHRARALLHDRAEAARAEAEPAGPADRPRQAALCAEAEALSRSQGCEDLSERIASLKAAWTDLIPAVDDDLQERFSAALRKARERLARNQTERAERERREQMDRDLRERHLAPRLGLCEMVERAPGDEAPRALEDARWEWERLATVAEGDPELVAEAAALSKRFEESCHACQARHEQWLKEEAEASRSAQEAEEREERAKQRRETAERQRENARRLQALCERADRLLQSGSLELRKARPVLREVRAALDDMPPLPSRRIHHSLVERLKAIQGALAPTVKDLREADDWMRWANANVQEELCARAEALGEIEDPVEAARRANDLVERWKSASTATPDRAQELWQRFKAARDAILARLETHRALQAARKTSLAEQAEALVAPFAAEPGPPPTTPPADWTRTAEALKRLQEEWKGIGSAGRAQDKALWERLRSACDRFFKRRAQDLGRRKEEWAKNLERKEALAVRAEVLAESTEWSGSAAEFKRLQTEWKGIGPVRRSRADAIWARFHSACNRFFERYKRRDQIDAEARVAAREAILRDLEALAPEQPATDPAAAGAILESLRSLLSRWQACGPLPLDQSAPLEARLDAAARRLVDLHPEAAKGTDLDFEQNRRALEDLCARVERLLPSAAPQGGSALSPAARLAMEWREAMASNTIGGKAAEEAKWRTALEEAKKAQIARRKIGHLPELVRRSLEERFERACREIAERASRSRPAPVPARSSGRRR